MTNLGGNLDAYASMLQPWFNVCSLFERGMITQMINLIICFSKMFSFPFFSESYRDYMLKITTCGFGKDFMGMSGFGCGDPFTLRNYLSSLLKPPSQTNERQNTKNLQKDKKKLTGEQQ